VVKALQPGAVVTSLSFSYRYCVGFASTGVGSNFTLKLGSSAAYVSPHFTDYPYSKASDPNKVYSPSVNVTVDINMTIPTSGVVSRIEFDFENVARNVQLMLPMTIAITCAGGSCLKPPPPPPKPVDVTVDFSTLGLASSVTTAGVRDIWAKKDIADATGGVLKAKVGPEDSAFFMLTPK
jgi:hypothetical protein